MIKHVIVLDGRGYLLFRHTLLRAVSAAALELSLRGRGVNHSEILVDLAGVAMFSIFGTTRRIR